MINSNDNNDLKRTVLMCVAAASCVLLACLLFLFVQDNNKKKKVVPVVNGSEEEAALEEQEEVEYGKKNFVSEDLDFWNLDAMKSSNKNSDDEEAEVDSDEENHATTDFESVKNGTAYKNDNDDPDIDAADASMNNNKTKKEKKKNSKSISVALEDGSFAEYDIKESIKKNSYDFEKYLKKSGKGYIYDDGNAKVGVDISKNNGSVDFQKLKSSGIDFCMIKVGARGYSTGEITLDDKFVENATNAKEAGIPVGAYFYSMATTDVEALEEANYAVAACMNYGLKYPIAIDMEIVNNDDYRSKNLSNEQRTKIVKVFCDTVKTYGMTPMIYANKSYLVSKLNLEELSSYDVWLCDSAAEKISLKESNSNEADDAKEVKEKENKNSKDNKNVIESTKNNVTEKEEDMMDYSDYPYWYTMWQYCQNATVDGINGEVDLNICFVDFESR